MSVCPKRGLHTLVALSTTQVVLSLNAASRTRNNRHHRGFAQEVCGTFAWHLYAHKGRRRAPLWEPACG